MNSDSHCGQSKSGSVLFLLKKVNFETEAKFECDGYKGRL